MAMMIACKVSKFFVFMLSVFLGFFMAAFAGDFNQDVEVTWGGDRAKIFNGGNALSLTLDKASGSGFQSKREYHFGRIDMEIRLVAGNSAGTVTTYYLSSQGPNHDEIDFEFLGNLSGHPYTVHTNIYAQGEGDREQQFHLWFDPTKDFHLYSIIWNPHRIIFLVDDVPIRVYENEEPIGVPFPNKQPMKLYSSLWNADQWATRGGQVKTDWSNAPFTACYRNFKANACLGASSSASSTSCSASSKTTATTGSTIEGVGASSGAAWQTQGLDANAQRRLRWVQKYYMIYNYCADYKRFPQGRPRECRRARFF